MLVYSTELPEHASNNLDEDPKIYADIFQDEVM